MNSSAPDSQLTRQDAAQGAGTDEIDLLALFGVLWRAKWLIAFFAALSMAVGVVYLLRVAVPIYTATAVVAFDNREEQVTDLESVIAGLSSDQASINTEIEVIRSRQLLGKLVDDLILAADPEFNPSLQDVSLLDQAIADLRGRPARPDLDAEQSRDVAIEALNARLSVTNVRQSYVFRITVRTTSPRKSATIANGIADLYINDQLEVKREATETAIAFLTERAADLQVELEQSELRVKDFVASTELVSPEALALKNRQLKDLRDRVSAGEATQAALADRLSALREIKTSDDPLPAVQALDDRGLIASAERLANGELDRARFDVILDGMIARTESDLERERSQTEALRRSIAELADDIEAQSSDLLSLQQLERESEANRLLYEYFLTRTKETAVQQGIQQPDARTLSPAPIPRSPSSPRKTLVLAMAMILGGLAGCILAIVRELRQNKVRTAEDLESLTGATVLGQIPVAKIRRRKGLIDYIEKKPNSAFAETVRNLRTSVLLSNVDAPPRILMLTSSVPGEGKTTLSLSLAKNLSGLGKKTLLIEADIRRRTFDQYFDTRNKPKLVDAVLSDEPIQDFAIEEPQLGVHLLFGGRSGINAADFFASDKFEAFMRRAREEFDYVVIDTPPVLAVPDARIIGQHADAILYAVHWDRTPRLQVQAGLRAFRDVQLRVSGTVLTQIDPKGMKRYGYGSSYASYANKYYEN